MLKVCVVDKRQFETYDVRKGNNYHHYHGARSKYKRPMHSKTCSKKCAREFRHNREKYLKILKDLDLTNGN